MRQPKQSLLKLAAAAAVLFLPFAPGLRAAEDDLVPPQLPKEQRENLLRFLRQHGKPDHFFPPDAKVVGRQAATPEPGPDRAPDKPVAVKQYTVQILSHRPVP